MDRDTAAAFRAAAKAHGIVVAGSHDSYLINLASPDRGLRERSLRSFCRELERCETLGLDLAGLRRNAAAIRRALLRVGGNVPILLESTAGQGRSLGESFEELAVLLEGVGPEFQDRLGVCVDTAHVLAAGYDLAGDYEGVMQEFDRVLGLARLRLFHLNDSKTPLGSRVDRHEQIGDGYLGREPFRLIMRDRRFRDVPKVIETPKGDDPVRNDRRNLNYLRRCSQRLTKN